jgi:hypothetical protein
MEYAREAPKSVVFERCPGPLVAAFFDGGPSKIHPIGGCSSCFRDVRIVKSVGDPFLTTCGVCRYFYTCTNAYENY